MPAETSAVDALSAIGRAIASAPLTVTDSLSENFLIRPLGRTVSMVDDSDDALQSALARLSEDLSAGPLEDAEHGYVLIGPNTAQGRRSVWTARVRNGRIAAAFELEDREAALRLIPTVLAKRPAAKVVEAALWALAERDLRAAAPLFDEKYVYSDPVAGLHLEGAATAINGVLLGFAQLDERILAGLEVSDLGGGIVTVTGPVYEGGASADPDQSRRWRVLVSVEDGRLRWTMRRPDEEVEP